MQSIVSKNLRQLRLSQQFTQEQAAERLNVSPQSVSRWECGSTFPDVLILPDIARLYGVTVDDLFHENPIAYQNYASRLCSVYEASGQPEDFLRAEFEYRKLIRDGKDTAEDLYSYGVLHQIMMNNCRKRALQLFDQILANSQQEDQETWDRTMRQKMSLLSQIGQNRQNIENQRKALEQDNTNPSCWLYVVIAYYHAGENEEAYRWFQKTLARFADFPNAASLYVYGGDICRRLHRYDEAFQYWDQAVELDETCFDAQYSKGFCYQDLGQWEKAYGVWQDIIQSLQQKGFDIEVDFPKQLAQKCQEKLSQNQTS